MTCENKDISASSVKGPGEFPALDGKRLRIAIVHARWNTRKDTFFSFFLFF